MPRYDYRCPHGHVTERQFAMSDDLPASVPCEGTITHRGDPDVCPHHAVEGAMQAPVELCICPQPCDESAARVFAVPAAIHFRGPGFYETDYRGRYDRKRRPNPGDDLPLPSEAAITKAEGAEYDPPKKMPATVTREDAKRAA